MAIPVSKPLYSMCQQISAGVTLSVTPFPAFSDEIKSLIRHLLKGISPFFFFFLEVLLLLFFNVYLFLSGGRDRERGGQRIRSGLCADRRKPDVGLELMNHEIKT